MNHPLTFQTVEFKVIDHKGQTWLTQGDIACALHGIAQGVGQSDPAFDAANRATRRTYSRHAHEFRTDMTALVKVQTAGGMQTVRIFSLRGAHLLGMFARTAKAEAFRRWVLDVLEGITHAPATLYARLIEAQRKEAESFADASCHAKALRQRQKIKPKLNDEIDKANAALQLALPLEGGAA